jgi:CRP/FNR family transcriptional regulator
MMSHEITSEQNVIMLLGNMRAEQRFAAFLVNLSSRYAARGYSSTRFLLHDAPGRGQLSRPDHREHQPPDLKFRKLGLLAVEQRDVEVIDLPALKRLAAGVDLHAPHLPRPHAQQSWG